jgi:hypothetical protein
MTLFEHKRDAKEFFGKTIFYCRERALRTRKETHCQQRTTQKVTRPLVALDFGLFQFARLYISIRTLMMLSSAGNNSVAQPGHLQVRQDAIEKSLKETLASRAETQVRGKLAQFQSFFLLGADL